MNVQETPIQAFAHCINPRCPGHNQEELEVTRTETSHAYRDRGGDMPGIEASFVTFQLSEEDAPCPHCGRDREVSDQPRRTYAPLSGHDPMGLLQVNQFDPQRQAEVRQVPPVDEERQAMEAENKLLRERLDALEQKGDT